MHIFLNVEGLHFPNYQVSPWKLCMQCSSPQSLLYIIMIKWDSEYLLQSVRVYEGHRENNQRNNQFISILAV